LEIVRFLVVSNADINKAANDGSTPLIAGKILINLNQKIIMLI